MTKRYKTGTPISVVLLAAALLLLIGTAGGDRAGDGDRSQVPPARVPGPERLPQLARQAFPDRPVPSLETRPVNGPSFAIARLRRGQSAPLHASPGGRVVRTVGPRTEFGSRIVLAVVRRRPGWLGVLTAQLGNRRIGWLRLDPARMGVYWTKYSIQIDLSRLRLALRYGDRRVVGFPVSIGAPGSETPAGRFAVTDAVSFDQSPYYGCCALALNGHQPKLPPGWLGGDRIAIHGTPGPVGEAASSGCIRATDQTMRFLFDRLPLGTPVFVSQ